MQECVRSPHRVEILVTLLKERIQRDEGADWGSPCLGGVCLLSGERGVWSYRKETNGECGFSVQSYSPETERDAPLGDLGRAPPFGSLRMYPAPDNSTDVASECNDDQWQPYFGMLLEEMKRPTLAVAVGAEESEQLGRPGPTLKTSERAELYKPFKDAHPEWSQSRVAIEANFQENVDYHTRDTVRNAYRAMGWKWERSDRIR